MCRAKFIANIQKNAPFPMRFSVCFAELCKTKPCCYCDIAATRAYDKLGHVHLFIIRLNSTHKNKIGEL